MSNPFDLAWTRQTAPSPPRASKPSPTRSTTWGRVVWLGLLALLIPWVASADVMVCLSTEHCQTFPDSTSGDAEFAGLQEALDHVNTWPHRNTEAFLYIEPGLYTNEDRPIHGSVANQVWRPQCQSRSGFAGFVLAQRGAPTTIEGLGDEPSEVQIWAKIPDQILENPVSYVNNGQSYYKIFHGFGLQTNAPVTLRNVSVISDGGLTENGAGDATLNINNTDLLIEDSLILANKGPSNCLRNFAGDDFVPGPAIPGRSLQLDQEGIVVDGGDLTLLHTVVGGNIHTGVMVINGGTALVSESLVRGNGWDKNHFQSTQKGLGVTSYHHSSSTSCYGGDTQIDIEASSVISNRGSGVLLRGAFNDTDQAILDSDLSGNSKWGFAINGGCTGGLTTLRNGSTITAQGNDYGSYGIRIDCTDIDASSSVVVDESYSWSNVTGRHRITVDPEPGGTPWSSDTRWTQLRTVGDAIGNLDRVCPDGF